ncbi:uncharacterized protein YaiI (UPF0178 family) [Bacillus ectoiniformans]|uniref:YaiI/YqxD family protein n=1 Tax=Bacillus ectoiniformans TaxID=1494429 RepID=UPI00195CB089|nr:YaiI/YqxD family protein [Bacillus ectoiniformans]MBM7650010.1 uncharacterized protein YaiI (UPF0178 family) [Bacillus ectoiniformans]
MKIFVDADSCPVKQEILTLAKEYKIEAVFVASIRHMMNQTMEGTWKYVDPDAEAADLYIFNHLQKGDVLVTQDIGLAGLALSKQVNVVSPRGHVYHEDNMANELHFRHLAAKARRSGVYSKGPKAFTDADNSRFMVNMKNILSQAAGR